MCATFRVWHFIAKVRPSRVLLPSATMIGSASDGHFSTICLKVRTIQSREPQAKADGQHMMEQEINIGFESQGLLYTAGPACLF